MGQGILLTNEREVIIILCAIYVYSRTNDTLLSLFCILTSLIHMRKLIENYKDNKQLFDDNRYVTIATICLYLSFVIYIATGDYRLFFIMFIYSRHAIQSSVSTMPTMSTVSQTQLIPDVYLLIASLGGLLFTRDSSFYFLFVMEIVNKLIF